MSNCNVVQVQTDGKKLRDSWLHHFFFFFWLRCDDKQRTLKCNMGFDSAVFLDTQNDKLRSNN